MGGIDQKIRLGLLLPCSASLAPCLPDVCLFFIGTILFYLFLIFISCAVSLNVAVAAHWNATVLLFQTRIDRIGARVIGFFPVPLWCHFGWASEEARIDLPHHPVVLWWSCSWTEERRLLLTTASHECNVFVLASKNTYPLSHTHIQDTDNDWQSTLLGRVKYGQHNHLWAVLGFVFACCITVYRWTFSGPSHYMLHGGGGHWRWNSTKRPC